MPICYGEVEASPDWPEIRFHPDPTASVNGTAKKDASQESSLEPRTSRVKSEARATGRHVDAHDRWII